MHRLIFSVGLVAVAFACGGSGGASGGGSAGGGSSASGGGSAATSCSAANCAGCCFNDACQTGTAASACGKGGAACFKCINGAVCKSDQTCGFDANTNWKLQPASATVVTNGKWDVGGGAPDLFVALFCPATVGTATTTTAVVDDSFSATWTTTSGAGCTMTTAALLSTGFGAVLLDEDLTSNDTVLSATPVVLTEGHLATGFVEFNATADVQAFRINLIRQ